MTQRPPIDRGASASESLRTDERAQTVLDYGISVGIFFVALVFVLGTIPGIFAPFVGSNVDTQVADRLASSLSVDMLGSPRDPFILNATCTEEFFIQLDGGGAAQESCRFDNTSTDLQTMFGLASTTNVRVEINQLNGTTGTLNGTTLIAGGTQPTQQSVSTAQRVIGIEGESHTLEVHVW